MWGDTPAIGQRFIVFGQLREVVGVIEDCKYSEIAESPLPGFYLPLPQNEPAATTFVVRSPRAQNETAAALERTLSRETRRPSLECRPNTTNMACRVTLPPSTPPNSLIKIRFKTHNRPQTRAASFKRRYPK